MRRADLSEAGKDLELEVEDLGDGFDDHVDVVEVVHVGSGCQAFASRICVGLAELLLRDILCEELVYIRVSCLLERYSGMSTMYLRTQDLCPMTSGCCPIR